MSDWKSRAHAARTKAADAKKKKDQGHGTNGEAQRAESSATKQAADEAMPWDDPISLDAHPAVPAFPVAALPGWLADFVEAEATATQTPPDLTAMLALAHAGAAIAGKVRVIVREGWTEPLNVYAVVALHSGERKSAVFAAAMAPAYEYEAKRRADMAPVIAAARSEHAMLEARQKHLAGCCAKEGDANKRNKLREQMKEAARELANHVVPEEPQIICDEVTPEKLTELLVRQGGRMLQAGPEGTPFEIAKGRYSESANFDVYLKGHAGDPLRSDRVSRDRLANDSPALSLALAIQPDVIRGLADEATMRARGFLARLLFAVPKSLVGSRRIAPAAVPPAIATAYKQRMLKLWNIPCDMGEDGKPSPTWVRFTPEADDAMRDFERWLEPLLGEGGAFSYLAGWANKLAGGIARIAAILHLAAREDGQRSAAIDRETADAAIRIGRDYLLQHAQAAFALLGADPRLPEAKRVIRWLKDSLNSLNTLKGPRVISRSDIHAGVWGGSLGVESVTDIVNLLVRYGWLRTVTEKEKSGPGRKPSPRFEIHPNVFSRVLSENSENSENRNSGVSDEVCRPDCRPSNSENSNSREPGEEG